MGSLAFTQRQSSAARQNFKSSSLNGQNLYPLGVVYFLPVPSGKWLILQVVYLKTIGFGSYLFYQCP